MAQREFPVYLFTGFLDSGKTTFIQSTLEDSRFNAGEKTLLLICEEGEVEFDPSAFSGKNVYVRTLEDEEELNEPNLRKLQAETGAVRAVVEYNGMWSLRTLFENMPENWLIAQEICFMAAPTFSVYNANMRNLVFEKLQTCDVVLFNRCADGMDLEALHKAVRPANRRCNIFYEYPDGRSVPDDFEDPLPFDLNAPIVHIEDRDYAYFFADLMEDPEKYEGKTVEYLAMVASDRPLPGDAIVAGRPLMNCCAADTQLAGMVFHWHEKKKPKKGEWFRVTGKVGVVKNRLRSGTVPVLKVLGAVSEQEPEEPVATFY